MDADVLEIAVNRDLEQHDPPQVVKYKNKAKGPEFVQSAVPSRSKKAPTTVFLIKDYISVDKSGISKTFPEMVCAVTDKPLDVVPDDEKGHEFEVSIAHEVGHALQNLQLPNEARTNDGHHYWANILMCKDREAQRSTSR